MLSETKHIGTEFWNLDSPTIWDLVFLLDHKYGYTNRRRTRKSAETWCDVETLIQQLLNFWHIGKNIYSRDLKTNSFHTTS
ncbi:MAG: hypothetical protein J6575_06515 [Bifidobacterium sp.]|nr:hypothetical protein [Bifidobacterium sp.]